MNSLIPRGPECHLKIKEKVFNSWFTNKKTGIKYELLNLILFQIKTKEKKKLVYFMSHTVYRFHSKENFSKNYPTFFYFGGWCHLYKTDIKKNVWYTPPQMTPERNIVFYD